MKVITKRLTKGQDLKNELLKLALENKIKGGVVLSVVGSLTKATVRVPVINGEIKTFTKEEELEITSATGTISKEGESLHVHISFSDIEGNCFGGHLLEGCITKTTIELAILSLDDQTYTREMDSNTGFKELKVTY